MATFTQLRSQLRGLESEAQNLLSEYSSFAQSISSSPTEHEVKVIQAIDENLSKV